MRGSHVRASVGGTSNYDWAADFAAGHITNTAGIVHDLVISHVGEAPEHQLHHRTKSKHRSAYPHPDKSRFADWGIDYALVAETGPKAFRHFVSAVVLRYFLPDDDHVVVARDFLREGIVQSFAIGDFRHGCKRELVVEKMPAGPACLGLVVHFVINVGEYIRLGRLRALLCEFRRRLGLGLGLLVQLLPLFFGQDTLPNQRRLPETQRIVKLLVLFNFGRVPVLLGIGVRDRVTIITVGLDLQDGGPRLLVGAFDGGPRFGPHLVNIFPVYFVPENIVSLRTGCETPLESRGTLQAGPHRILIIFDDIDHRQI